MNDKYTQVYVTDCYKMFKHLDGNRQVKDGRVAGIVKSIGKVGYLCSPLLVNEKMEIIDGQGRFEAAKRLNLPVYYIVQKGIGLTECRSMNQKQSNWTLDDFIESYCETGDQNYTYLRQLYKEFRGRLGSDTLLSVATESYGTLGKYSVKTSEKIKSGELVFTEDDYAAARKICVFLNECIDVIKTIGGRQYNYIKVLMFAYYCKDIDHNDLKRRLYKHQAFLIPTTTISQAAEVIEKIYNYGNRNKVYIATAYRQEMEKRTSTLKKGAH